MTITEYITDQYGPNAIPFEMDAPFNENNLMVKEWNGYKLRQFSPSVKGIDYFVVAYHKPQMYRLDWHYDEMTAKGTISVKETVVHEMTVFTGTIALYEFQMEKNVASLKFVEGKNLFMDKIMQVIKYTKIVEDKFLWVEL